MSSRIQRSCLIISALVLNLAPGLDAQARPELPTAETGPGFKSGTTALVWSLLGTLVPIGVGVVASSTAGEASDNPLPGFLILGGMLVGPALGHFYAGRSGHALAGIGIRTVTLAAFLGGAAASWNGVTPPGTALGVSVRVGNTPVPDDSWTAFIPLAGSGKRIEAPPARYVQYRSDLTTTDPAQTPVLNDITISYVIRP